MPSEIVWRINSRSSGETLTALQRHGGKRTGDARSKIESLDQYCPCHFNAMFDTGWHPDGAWWYDPVALSGMHPHHSLAGVDQLVPVVSVRRDHPTVEMPGGEAADHDPVLDVATRHRGL